eukprot:1812745-Karenia_brevis.AAC.1
MAEQNARDCVSTVNNVRDQVQVDYNSHTDNTVDPAWDRKPDFTVLRASAAINFSKDALKAACAGWLTEFQDNQYEFLGPHDSIAKNWGIKFRGNERIVAHR